TCRYLKITPIWSIVAVALLCFCPEFISSATQTMSDLLATAWALATLYCALRCQRDDLYWSFLCGATAMMAVLIRPTNALLAFPMLVAIGMRPTRLIVTFLGALRGLIFQCFVNWKLYGNPFITGYGSFFSMMDGKNLSSSYVPQHLGH